MPTYGVFDNLYSDLSFIKYHNLVKGNFLPTFAEAVDRVAIRDQSKRKKMALILDLYVVNYKNNSYLICLNWAYFLITK